MRFFSELDIEAYWRVSHGEKVSFQNSRLPPIIVFHMMKCFHFRLDITTYDRVSHGEIVLFQNSRPPLIRLIMVSFWNSPDIKVGIDKSY